MTSNQPAAGSKSNAAAASARKAIFTPTFFAVSLINMFGLAGYYAIFVVSAGWLSGVFHTSTAIAGLATGIIVIGCLVGRFFTGSIVHSAGYRRVLAAGALLYLATNVSYFFVDSLPLVFLVRFVSGLAIGIIGTATGTIVAVAVPSQFHGRGIAYFSMSTALSLCVGPFVGIALLSKIGYEGIFTVSTALSVLSLLLIPLVRVQAQRRTDHHKLSLSDFIEPKLVPFSLMVCVVCLAWGNIQAFLADYAAENDVLGPASSFFLIYAAAILLTRPFTGKIYDAHGAPVVLYPSLALLAAGLMLLWAWPSTVGVLLAAVLAGLGFGNFQSVAQVSAIAMVKRERYAQATSTFYVFWDLGLGLAPYLSGYVIPFSGYAGLYGLNSIVVVGTIVWYFLLVRSMRHVKRPASGEAVDFSKGEKQD